MRVNGDTLEVLFVCYGRLFVSRVHKDVARLGSWGADDATRGEKRTLPPAALTRSANKSWEITLPTAFFDHCAKKQFLVVILSI
jgi:hypothetical protein